MIDYWFQRDNLCDIIVEYLRDLVQNNMNIKSLKKAIVQSIISRPTTRFLGTAEIDLLYQILSS